MTEMNKHERVKAALDGKAVDRPPVSFWFHYFDELRVGEACIQAHADYYRQTDIDFIKVMSDGYFEYPVPDTIREAGDWLNLKPLEPSHPYIREQIERARGIREATNGECPVFYSVFAPFSSIRFGTANDLVMRHLTQNPEAVIHALDVIAESNALLAELLITEGGCDGIYYCLQGGEQSRFTARQYKEWITPSDRKVLEHANRFSSYNLLHFCGWAGVKNHLEVWRDYPAKAVNWAVSVEEMSLRQGQDFFGGKAVIGGFDNRPGSVLYTGNKAELDAGVQDIMKDFAGNGLLIGADCSLENTIDPGQIRKVVMAAAGK
ncbi:uroporphyrinogen decarboxylase family protein [Paenibacillus sp. FSL R7-0331]|uniref:uroporphyrinogen decarboxylase family protein n=1 Tax=Paenibacillus sp. FSL R7-0331 TaxID=1536773 RepID=UPI000AE250F5|nr:uroporphyrinogen decarboxylase family protein [Paenibacillus sp. FSL R7-0331]